jgi:uncharacterized protein involved in tolerance to divalent cations
MINIYIYLNKEEMATRCAQTLVKEKLVARASIDINNKVLQNQNDLLITETICVITAQTKAILFTKIVEFIQTNFDKNASIFSTPLTQANDNLSLFIRENTQDIKS